MAECVSYYIVVYLVAFLFTEEIYTPVGEIEQRKCKRKEYPRDNVDFFRSRTISPTPTQTS